MIKLGKIQTLTVVRDSVFGAYLNLENNDEKDILLPKKQVPPGARIGDSIEVFVYRDSEDRLIATTMKPLVTLGELAVLRVVSVSKIGAFLYWGLEKDLFLPFKEQTHKVELGKDYLISLYADKSNRLCATMDVYHKLNNKSPYKENDKVNGIIYDIKENMGVFVAVDNKYYGLIPPKEIFKNYSIGDTVEARVTAVREDGKLNLSAREKAYMQMDTDADLILKKLAKNNGRLRLNDKSDPEIIKKELQLSKNAFKRAVGRLLKEGKIELTEDEIRTK